MARIESHSSSGCEIQRRAASMRNADRTTKRCLAVPAIRARRATGRSAALVLLLSISGTTVVAERPSSKGAFASTGAARGGRHGMLKVGVDAHGGYGVSRHRDGSHRPRQSRVAAPDALRVHSQRGIGGISLSEEMSSVVPGNVNVSKQGEQEANPELSADTAVPESFAGLPVPVIAEGTRNNSVPFQSTGEKLTESELLHEPVERGAINNSGSAVTAVLTEVDGTRAPTWTDEKVTAVSTDRVGQVVDAVHEATAPNVGSAEADDAVESAKAIATGAAHSLSEVQTASAKALGVHLSPLGLIGGHVMFQSIASGHRFCGLDEERIECKWAKAGPSQAFRIMDTGDGTVAIQPMKKDVFCSDDVSANHIICNRKDIGKWERFVLRFAGEGRVAIVSGSDDFCGDTDGIIRCDHKTLDDASRFIVLKVEEKSSALQLEAVQMDVHVADEKKQSSESAGSGSSFVGVATKGRSNYRGSGPDKDDDSGDEKSKGKGEDKEDDSGDEKSKGKGEDKEDDSGDEKSKGKGEDKDEKGDLDEDEGDEDEKGKGKDGDDGDGKDTSDDKSDDNKSSGNDSDTESDDSSSSGNGSDADEGEKDKSGAEFRRPTLASLGVCVVILTMLIGD
eukprot:TRINITY_DN195_c0_g1_i7.p1 TRINITY_DN195_c0_g1~~TRINITY_DN195_c0_g1_i7.p1  ORF type:complete len:622 (-),score=133.02 TRINITY_DN195_c0_g1_i7:118-1983(-)